MDNYKKRSKKSRKSGRLVSKRTDNKPREHHSRAMSNMSMTELQFMAKSRGIPFGGLKKSKLIRKINNYKE
jgi:hypothetical protein